MGATRNCREKERTDMNSFYKAPGTPDDNQDNRTRTERAHHESQIVPVSGVSKFPGAGRAVRHCYINLSLDGNQWCALFGSDLQGRAKSPTSERPAMRNLTFWERHVARPAFPVCGRRSAHCSSDY